MRAIKFLFFVILFFLTLNSQDAFSMDDKIRLNYNSLEKEVIRFHFLANSDSDYDQYIKNSLKDHMIKYLDDLNLKVDKHHALNTLRENKEDLERECEKFLRSIGYNKDVRIEIGNKYFKDREYGEYIVPEGAYDYFIVYIGDGEGKNFWSLLFSNIGFINSGDKDIDSILSLVKNNKEVEAFTLSSKGKKVRVSFKLPEIIKGFFKKIF